MPLPVPDKNIERAYRLRYTGKELEAALTALEAYPTYREDCFEKKAKKEQLRMDYMKLLLKKQSAGKGA